MRGFFSYGLISDSLRSSIFIVRFLKVVFLSQNECHLSRPLGFVTGDSFYGGTRGPGVRCVACAEFFSGQNESAYEVAPEELGQQALGFVMLFGQINAEFAFDPADHALRHLW